MTGVFPQWTITFHHREQPRALVINCQAPNQYQATKYGWDTLLLPEAEGTLAREHWFLYSVVESVQ